VIRDTPVVYHGVPKGMSGTTLFPLYQLEAVAPDLFAFQRSKYAGRETVLDVRIPGLGIRFNDTVQCAAIHPAKMWAARRRLGITPLPANEGHWTGLFYAIPLARVLVHPVVWYAHRTLWINGAPGEDVPLQPPANEFEAFDPDRYRELDALPPAHLAHLESRWASGRRPLAFVNIPHVLVAGPIDVSGLEPFSWEDATAPALPPQRVAVAADIAGITKLMQSSIRALFPSFYNARQTASAVVHVGHLDTRLIEDGTYFVHEADGEIVACGGWSRRALLYTGSDPQANDDRLLDPRTEPARVRAMFVRADWTRRGLGRAILDACRHAARAEGFSTLALMATLPGEPLYRAFGFREIRREPVLMPDGVSIECVAMERAISG